MQIYGSRRFKLKKKLNRSISGNIFFFLMIVLLGAFTALPLVLAISNAFKPLDEIFLFPPRLFVRNPTMENFSDLILLMQNAWVPFLRHVANSLVITAAGTALNIIVASLCAYPLAKMKLPFSNLIFGLIILTLMFSREITTIPNYLLMSRLGIINTQWAVILPAIGGSIGLFLMKQFIEANVPDSLLEAAKIDGAGEIRILFRIVMPIVKPAWLTMIIFNVQALWNDSGALLLYNEELKPLPYALSQILLGGLQRTGTMAAATLIIMLVPITIFIVTQSHIIETMGSSGIKE